MGTQKRRRRAEKAATAQQRAGQRAGRGEQSGPSSATGPTGPAQGDARDQVRGLLHLAVSEPDTDRGVAALELLAEADPALVDRQAEGEVLVGVAVLWDNGWQPVELVRHGRRLDGRVGRLVATAVAADHLHRPASSLHPRWAAQLESLDLPAVTATTGWLAAFARREGLDRRALVGVVVSAVRSLSRAPRLHTIIPPPGASVRSILDADPSVDDPVLVKVRALLAQAESTTFAAEAETFTAKAQQLMARHAIDAAMLWASTSRDERPTTIRLPIDDPYADIKSLLLQYVASHSRCSAVWDGANALSTVVGFASDVASTEMLFTSLLVQSQAALGAEGAKAGPGSRARSRNFRSSFLLSFSRRIDQRLAEITASVEQEAEAEADAGTGESLLPVLASRDHAVQDTVAELFGALNSSAVRAGDDAAGWARGHLAADLATLNAADLAAATEPAPS
jgi:hypothetical protein